MADSIGSVGKGNILPDYGRFDRTAFEEGIRDGGSDRVSISSGRCSDDRATGKAGERKESEPPEQAMPQSEARADENQTPRILIESSDLKRGKGEIIDGFLNDSMGEGQREKIHRRLEKFPAAALELLEKNHLKISDRPLDLGDSDIGRYDSSKDTVRIGRGCYVDYFIDHPGVSSFFAGKYPPAVKAGTQFAFVASAIALFTLPLSLSLAVVGGLTLAPLSMVLLSKIRDRSVKDPLEHEVAHALDVALGRSMSQEGICDAIKSDPSLKHYNHLDENVPFSLKCPEVADLYRKCRDGESSFVTLYAGNRVEEYFAESLRAYLNRTRLGNDASREDLLRKDPAMHGFIERLLADIDSGKYRESTS